MLIYTRNFDINQQIFIFVNMNEYTETDLYEKSDKDIIAKFGRRFRDYRTALRLTQKEVSEQSGVSVMTIVRFERGENTSIRLDNFVALMRAIQRLDLIADVIPEMPASLYDNGQTGKRQVRYRVKKRKNER